MRSHDVARPLLALALLLPAVLSGSTGEATAIGTAYDQDSGYLLYTEYHFCAQEGGICTVEYLDPSGSRIAQKTLDYRGGSFSPALHMIDYRLDRELKVPAIERDDVVVDAGFDNYVRSIWDQLEGGESVRFPFLVAGFDKPIDMRAGLATSGDCHPAELCLEVSLDSWWLGLLASPIELSYSRESRQLLRFRGVSNIKGEAGESLSVDIRYRYDEQMLLVGPTAQPVIGF